MADEPEKPEDTPNVPARRQARRQGESVEIDPKDLKDAIWAARNGNLQSYECPMCKSLGNWFMHQDIFVVARPGAVQAINVIPAHQDTYATNNDTAYRADCLHCGFIALFRVGIGPR